MRDAQLRSGNERLGRDEANAMREGQFDANKLGYSRDVAVAGFEQPQLVQRGSTGSQQGTTVQSESPFKTAAGLASSVAPLSL